ncbi:hypothetical protein L1887_28917 [Cichorium endivia]|nr:hypothetical protein L1887_28917 [Cichorium endivia]
MPSSFHSPYSRIPFYLKTYKDLTIDFFSFNYDFLCCTPTTVCDLLHHASSSSSEFISSSLLKDEFGSITKVTQEQRFFKPTLMAKLCAIETFWANRWKCCGL